MKKVLVTGACGIIGDRVCSGLLKKGYSVIAVDKQLSPYNSKKNHFKFYEAKPNDKVKYVNIFETEDIDSIIHLACTADNDFGHIIDDEEIEMARVCNKYIFKLAMASDIKQCLMVSTTQVYEIPKTREPVREEDDIKIITNYAKLKYETEMAMADAFRGTRDTSLAIMRIPPVYTFDYYENLLAKILDSKDETAFVYRTGEYGFQFCCVHNLADFILCFMRHADNPAYTGIYNIADKTLTSASEIVGFLREHHRLGAVIQRKENPISGLLSRFKGGKEEKTNYRYLDFKTLLNNISYDTSKASRLCPFRWNLGNTK
ncbi:MAG: NAD(P)-dependent oxidoreductase [Clostridiales bacterium]|nr:NAD(P)-dependent oxidoreductase [Clostridiales bacterium]